jgi:transposase
MAQKFISCRRDQVLLLPPSLLDWVPEDHLVWTILGAVDELDLGAFYGAYRADGHGRPAFEPSMMVALLLYAYARGNRSSRGIERACREDVAYMVVSAMRAPDHSTIAEFRKRHETALGELFTGVLGLCRRAGLVEVGVIAIDGTKISANAAMGANAGYARISREILEQAAAIDAAEDELYGDARGDELPEQLRTREGRRAALREAKRELDAERDGLSEEEAAGTSEPLVRLDLDRERILSSEQGRRGWEREGRRKLDELREQQARPIAGGRLERLLESKRRLEEDHRVELECNMAYDAFRARGFDRSGRRLHNSLNKPYTPPEAPAGKINTTDHDSRLVGSLGQRTVQGYNAQAAVNERQIIVAAEVTVTSPDFGHLEPMVDAVLRELTKVGITDQPGVVVADPGYWHKQQIENIVSQGIQVLVPPDSGLRKHDTRPGWNKGLYAFMRNVLQTEPGKTIYTKRQATVEPVFGQIKFNRRTDRFQRRGRPAVRSEWRFAAATHNLLKLHTHQAATA